MHDEKVIVELRLTEDGNAVKANAEATIQTPQGELTIARLWQCG